jgi:hypothetical protein
LQNGHIRHSTHHVHGGIRRAGNDPPRACAGAIVVGWAISGVGMLFIVLVATSA